jgi:hypothetical protein
MEYIIQDLHQYLLDHFHTGPYKHGLDDTVIMTLKCLELICKKNHKKKDVQSNIDRFLFRPKQYEDTQCACSFA